MKELEKRINFPDFFQNFIKLPDFPLISMTTIKFPDNSLISLIAGHRTLYLKPNNNRVNSLLVLQNFTTARKKREHSLSILKAYSSDTRQSMKRRIKTERWTEIYSQIRMDSCDIMNTVSSWPCGWPLGTYYPLFNWRVQERKWTLFVYIRLDWSGDTFTFLNIIKELSTLSYKRGDFWHTRYSYGANSTKETPLEIEKEKRITKVIIKCR